MLRIRRIADGDLSNARLELLDELVVDLLVDDRARTRRALLPLEAERGNRDAFDRSVDVGIRGDDDRILAAHLGDDALDPLLSGLRSSPRAR